MTIFRKNKLTSSKNIMKTSLLVSSIVIALTSQAADLYQITDLGSLAPDTVANRTVEAFAINDAGTIVGNASGEDFISHAFSFRNQAISDLGSLPNEDENGVAEAGISFAFGINDNDIAVGYSIESFIVDPMADPIVKFDVNIAVYYDVNDLEVNRIPQFVPDDPKSASASAIESNIVVGNMLFDPPSDVDSDGNPVSFDYLRGFFYDISLDQLTIVHPLGNDDDRAISLRDLNSLGVAVGISEETIEDSLTRQVVMVDIDTPETLEKIQIFGGNNQQPWAVNDAGKIVGVANSITNSDPQAFIYANQAAIGLGFLNNNFKYSEAFDINESDQVVGVSQVESTPLYHAFLYESDTLKDLNDHIACDSGWQLIEARSINNSGVIAGTGIFDGEKRAFMLTPQTGNAPVCETDDNSGSGSWSPFILVLLTLFGLVGKVKR